MFNENVMRDFDPDKETMLDRYDSSRIMYERLMDRSLEQRFQQWINRRCSDQIKQYELCVADKHPWQLSQCLGDLDLITKCRLDYNTKAMRKEFLEREREILKEMDDNGEYLFDHDLYQPNWVKQKLEPRLDFGKKAVSGTLTHPNRVKQSEDKTTVISTSPTDITIPVRKPHSTSIE